MPYASNCPAVKRKPRPGRGVFAAAAKSGASASRRAETTQVPPTMSPTRRRSRLNIGIKVKTPIQINAE